MVDSCLECNSCHNGKEHYCESGETLFTYGYPDSKSPTGITQGGYSNQIVVRDHFAVHIPDSISLQEAAPLLCAGITTYSPLMNEGFNEGDKVGVAGIGGLGHMAVKLAASKGAEVYAFTTTGDKKQDIMEFGAREVIVVDDLVKLEPWRGRMDYMISTIPYAYNMSAYADCVKSYGNFTQVGVPVGGQLEINAFNMIFNRVNINFSLIGGIPETQEVINYCSNNNIRPRIEIIQAPQVNQAWEDVVNKKARYRFVIDASSI